MSHDPPPLIHPFDMRAPEPYEEQFSREDPEYRLRLAISQALDEPLQSLISEEATSWALPAHPQIITTHQEGTAEASDTKRKPGSSDMEETTRPKTRRRKGDPEPDYSGMTREVLKKNQRTGQACDRCKVCPITDLCPPASTILLLFV